MGKKNKRSKKQKVQRRIAKWISDGKITKKEANKARKQGISLNRIQKAQTKKYTKPKSVFAPQPTPQQLAARRRKPDSGPGSRPATQPPAYRPLIIKEGANRTFNTPQQTTSAPPQVGHSDPTEPAKPVDPQVTEPIDEGPSVEDMFAETIAGMQAQYEQSLALQQNQFAAMEAQQQQQMMALQQQMQMQQNAMSAQSQLAGRPSVLGVQNAVSSAGTPMQIARRGMGGSFDRGGMRIQSLNV